MLVSQDLDQATHGADLRGGLLRCPLHPLQSVEDLPTDAGDGVGGELQAALWLELLDGIHEADGTHRDQVVYLDVIREAAGHPPGLELHQRHVANDQLLAELGVAGAGVGLEVAHPIITFMLQGSNDCCPKGDDTPCFQPSARLRGLSIGSRPFHRRRRSFGGSGGCSRKRSGLKRPQRGCRGQSPHGPPGPKSLSPLVTYVGKLEFPQENKGFCTLDARSACISRVKLGYVGMFICTGLVADETLPHGSFVVESDETLRMTHETWLTLQYHAVMEQAGAYMWAQDPGQHVLPVALLEPMATSDLARSLELIDPEPSATCIYPPCLLPTVTTRDGYPLCSEHLALMQGWEELTAAF